MSELYIGGAPAPRRSSPWAWVVGILLVCGLLLLLAVAALVGFGWSLFADEAKAQLQADPAIVEHIGTISDLDLDLTATGDTEGENEFVWDIAGDKGKGRVVAELVTEDEGEALAGGTLTLPDGREFPLGAAPDDATLADAEVEADIEADAGMRRDNAKAGEAGKLAPEAEPAPVEVE